jgi:hypothetical protein
MGQAGAAPDTLPDPNEPAMVAASADDLLAQLAGEEIDRLLAETEDGPAPSSAVRASTSQPAADASDAAAAQSIETVEKMGDQLDALLKEIEAPKPGSPAESEARAATTTIAQFAAGTSSNEVNALLGEEGASAVEDNAPMPMYVRLLEALNSPFASMPNPLREFLGKVAILTLFNSLAVLVYVLIFRRH